MGFDVLPQVCINGERMSPLPGQGERLLAEGSPFHKFRRNTGFYLITRNLSKVHLELSQDCRFRTGHFLRPNKFTVEYTGAAFQFLYFLCTGADCLSIPLGACQGTSLWYPFCLVPFCGSQGWVKLRSPGLLSQGLSLGSIHPEN